jgi:UDP-N-acetylmuramyl pentapeptide phosphotransferase/UDP-N-acetylglucosamine-1-phosphate transferase
VPIGGGAVLVLTVVVVAAFDRVADAIRSEPTPAVISPPLLLTVLGFGMLGLVDDLLETGDVKGFRGHIAALGQGRLTTGAVKLVGGGLVALVVAPPQPEDRLLWLAIDAAVIALSANLANLLDRAPGRVTKATLILGTVLIAFNFDADESVGLAVVIGAAAGLLLPDLREQVMLGDAGANVLGAVLGWAFVLETPRAAHVVALVLVGGLNVLSERVSFSAVISRTPGLRELDHLGRRPRDD